MSRATVVVMRCDTLSATRFCARQIALLPRRARRFSAIEASRAPLAREPRKLLRRPGLAMVWLEQAVGLEVALALTVRIEAGCGDASRRAVTVHDLPVRRSAGKAALSESDGR